jgi:hypothetical protein
VSEGDDAPSSASLRAVEHALVRPLHPPARVPRRANALAMYAHRVCSWPGRSQDDVDGQEGAAETAKSPEGKAPPVLASPLAGGGKGSMASPTGPGPGGQNTGPPMGPGGQQYWIDQSGTVIGAFAAQASFCRFDCSTQR